MSTSGWSMGMMVIWSRAASYESLTRWSIASARTAAAPDEPVDDVARRLAGPEAGHLGSLGDVPVGGGEVAVDLGRRDLDLEGPPRPGLGSGGDGDQ